MNKKEYRKYLRSDAWAKKREQVSDAAGHRCQICNEVEYPNRRLHIHHRTYARVGKETLDDLIALCPRCHWIFTEHIHNGHKDKARLMEEKKHKEQEVDQEFVFNFEREEARGGLVEGGFQFDSLFVKDYLDVCALVIHGCNIFADNLLEMCGNYYRFGIHRCWKCSLLTPVFSWPGAGWSKKKPKGPIPRTVVFKHSKMKGDEYWLNICPFCNSVQGDFYLYLSGEGLFSGLDGIDNKESWARDMLTIANNYYESVQR